MWSRFNNRYFLFVPVCLALVCYSCTGNTEKQLSGAGIIADSLFTPDHDIRKFNFGMAREEFDLGDDSTVLENEKDYAVESVTIKADKNIFAECSYRFENDHLQSGEINIFTPGDSINKQVQDTLVKRLNKRFGQMSEARGFYTWKTKSKKGYKLEIFMGDVTQELGSAGQAVTGIRFYAELVERPMLAHHSFTLR